MMRPIAYSCLVGLLATLTSLPASAFEPQPIVMLKHDLRVQAAHAPGHVALDVVDLASGDRVAYDAGTSMPAASTIKVPVMVEVFRQLALGRFDMNTRVTLRASDKDWGSGDLCYAPAGESFDVETLLEKMIDISDNTAANMLIRLVGRSNINRTMHRLGLRRTHLYDDIRTDTSAVRYALRTSPADMVKLLSLMARGRLVDQWSSNEMIGILEGDEINTLLPEPLPGYVMIAHKTGSLHDTLDDVGIVYAQGAPYAIAVMTTNLYDLEAGRIFIRDVSKTAYEQMLAMADWRESAGIALPAALSGFAPALSPDIGTWIGNGR